MHHCCLLTAAARDIWRNSGHALITDGIRYLIRSAQPDVAFHEVDLTQRDAECWSWLLAHADSLVICGLPRLGSRLELYRDFGFWQDVLAAKAAGLRVADLFPGQHFKRQESPELYRDLVLAADANRTVLEYERSLDWVVPRDAIFADAAEALGARYLTMPCGSWWASRWWGLTPEQRAVDVIALRTDERVPEWALTELVRHAAQMAEVRPVIVATQNVEDYAVARLIGLPAVQLFTEPRDFLALMARTHTLVSLRVHATVPALSLGVRVLNIAIDSRSAAVDRFHIPSQPLDVLRADVLPTDLADTGLSDTAMQAHRQRFIRGWRERMQTRRASC